MINFEVQATELVAQIPTKKSRVINPSGQVNGYSAVTDISHLTKMRFLARGRGALGMIVYICCACRYATLHYTIYTIPFFIIHSNVHARDFDLLCHLCQSIMNKSTIAHMRYFININYDGTNYVGWQRQKNTRGRTVQEEIEKVLFSIFKETITVYGCGRTDAGVHASQYAMHINLAEAPKFDLKFRINKNLPPSIAVMEVFEVQEDQHCRYDAQTRTYDYFLHWKKDPLLLRYSSFYEYAEEGLDFAAMKKVTAMIGEAQDFKAICKQPELYDHTNCVITKSELYINVEQARMRFSITSNRFLRGMVRYCVFYILQVGSGKMSIDEFQRILHQEKTFVKKKPAHPNGLFLSEITYPFVKLSESNHLMQMLKSGLESS